MKPINDKERTVAYFQFLVLSLLFLVLWTVAVFFDYRVKAKDYQVIKDENKRLKENLTLSAALPHQIDSLIGEVHRISKGSETEFDIDRRRFNEELNFMWKINGADSSLLSKIRTSVSKIFREWTLSVGASINSSSKNEILKAKEAEIEKLEKELRQVSADFQIYRTTHPN